MRFARNATAALLVLMAPCLMTRSQAAIPDGLKPADNADRCSFLPRPVMRLRLTMPDEERDRTSAVVRQIVDDTWQPEGLAFEWLEDPATASAWVGVDAWVAIVPGMAPATADGVVMGEVLFDGEEPRRLIRVSLDAAEAWVRRDQATRYRTNTLNISPTLGSTGTLVRLALGLIVAHELGHFVLASRDHSPSGVMQSTFIAPARLLLGAPPLSLDPANRARLGARLADAADCP